MTKPTLILMTRWPAAGRCKKRLAKEIGPIRAAIIQQQLTRHTFSVAKALEKKGMVNIKLSIAGIAPKGIKRWGSKEGIKAVNQQGKGNLGLRMRRQILKAQVSPHSQINYGKTTIVIGTDLPNLCQLDLIRAIKYLENYEMVLGPANDGGYWLIGLTGRLVNPVATWPFSGIPWGTDQVLTKTLRLAEQLGTSHTVLNKQNDIDLIEDLAPWQG